MKQIDKELKGWIEFTKENLIEVIENKGFWSDWAKERAKLAF